MKTCTMPDCEHKVLARGFCATHYSRWRKRGDPNIVLTTSDWIIPLNDRYWAQVQKSTGCWLWIGATTRSGYGRIKLGSRPIVAHRLARELAFGPIPEGMIVCHACDNPRCVKTEGDDQFPNGHLFLGTQSDNMRDMWAKGRGRRVPQGIITDETAREIRNSSESTRSLATLYGISESHVWGIRTGRSHKKA